MRYSILINFQHQFKKEDYSANLIRKEIFQTKRLGFFYCKDKYILSGKLKRKSKFRPTYAIGFYLIWAKLWVTIRRN